MAKIKARDKNLVTLSAILRAREVKMTTKEQIDRMLSAPTALDGAKLLEENGYPNLEGKDVFQIEQAISKKRSAYFNEIAEVEEARPVLDLFAIKFDYHNVKTLVKAMAVGEDADRLLSESGRVSKEVIAEAFVSGDRDELPEKLALAMGTGEDILSHTFDPQLADIAIDKIYYDELLTAALSTGDDFIIGYVKLIIDSANLRTFVRSMRTGKSREFLENSVFEGGNAETEDIIQLPEDGAGIAEVFAEPSLKDAVSLAGGVISGGSQMEFERSCDNSVREYTDKVKYVAFGKAVILRHLLALEWEMTAIRMVLGGRLGGIDRKTIEERLRESYV